MLQKLCRSLVFSVFRGTGMACVVCLMLMTAWLPAAKSAEAQHYQRKGIGFAYAVEQGSGVCMGNSPEALDCARQVCAEQSGAYPSECMRVAWCYPSGWSVAVAFFSEASGAHWSEFSCGWPSKESAVAGGKILCSAHMQYKERDISECLVTVLWDPQGQEIVLE